MQNARRQLQFDLDDLLWDARLRHYSLQVTYAKYQRLADKYLRSAAPSELEEVRPLLEDFRSKLDSGAVTAFIGAS